jgi:hypothetical protein
MGLLTISLIQSHVYVKIWLKEGGQFSLTMTPNDGSCDNRHVAGGGLGDSNLRQNVDGRTFPLGEWHRLETYYKKSATTTSCDGSLIWWVDGILLGRYTNVNLAGPLEHFALCNIWDREYGDLPFEESVASRL